MKTTILHRPWRAMPYILLGLLAQTPQRAAAQLPTEHFVNILCPQTLPPALDAARLGARLASEQDFVAMPGHPQSYRLDLFGRPIRQLFIGGNVAHASSGLRQELSAEIDLAADLSLSPDWRFFGGLAARMRHRHYRRDGIVSKHPFYDEALAENRFRYTVGVLTAATYDFGDGQRLGFGTRADLATDDKSVCTRSYVFFDNKDPKQAKAACHTYFVHSFNSGLKTKHYYKAGCRLDLFQKRLALEAAYEASADLQTFATGISIGLYKGLTLSYDLSLPFRFDGRHAGMAAHTVALSYRLQQDKP